MYLPAHRGSADWLPSIFNGLFEDPFFAATASKQFTSPAVNIVENDKQFEIEVAAPGMAKEDLAVSLENDNELVIALEKKNNAEDGKKNYLRREFSYASYRQSFSIPEDVDLEGISAAMTDGVLHITLPKKEETVKEPACRKIEIM